MKKFILSLLLCVPFLASSQSVISFKLTPDATFISDTDENFVVVPFEGKSAHEIYQMLASNVGTVFNDPSKVMSGVPDASIKIRAYCDNLYLQKIMGITHLWGGYYQLEFRIKDGRVRVSAPIIEDAVRCSSIQGGVTGSMSHIVKKWFKDGVAKPKEVKNIENLESQMNYVVNAVLGLAGSTSDVDEDW